MPSLPAQLLIKHLPKLAPKKALVINAPDTELLSILPTESPTADWSFFDFDYSDYREKIAFAKHANLASKKLACGSQIPDSDTYDCIIIFLPKSRELLEYTFTLTSAHIASQGIVAIVGEKKGGIKSVSNALEQHIGKILWKEPGKHSEIITASFEKSPTSFQPTYTKTILPTQLADITLASLPGVFSLGALDKGTELLLHNLPENISGKVLDWGCGSGVIGTYIAKKFSGTSVDMVDSNMLAVASAQETIKANGLKNAHAFASDIFSDSTSKYDLIISNPPFHDGLETAYKATHTFFKNAPQFLNPNGRLLIVANTFLPYQKILTEVFGNCKVVAENPQFKVLESVR